MPWNASALMTVTGEGSATIVRGNANSHGQFVGTGQALRFTGRAQTLTVAGEVTRDCTVTFRKNPNAN